MISAGTIVNGGELLIRPCILYTEIISIIGTILMMVIAILTNINTYYVQLKFKAYQKSKVRNYLLLHLAIFGHVNKLE